MRLCVVAICALVAISAAAAATKSTTTSSAQDQLIVNLGQLVPTLDPASACHLVDAGVTNALYAQLTQYGTKPGPNGTVQEDPGVIKPYLAESWKISRGGTVYTFKLRPGMKFPSGKPVDAKAFKFSFERTIKINGCGAYGLIDGLYKPPLFKKIAAPNPTTLVLTLSKPDVNVLQNLAQWSAAVVDQSLVNAHGGVKANTQNDWMASHSAGYGPYLLQSYQPNKQAVLVANPNFAVPAKTKKIIVNFYSTPDPMLLAARSGQADVTLVLPKQAAHSLVGNKCCTVVANPIPAWDKIILPGKTTPFNNVKFRAALTYAVPYQQILKGILFGYGTLYYGPWSPAMPWFNPTIEKARSYDLSKAKALLAQSGVKTPVSFPILVPQGNAIEQQIATAVQASWAQIGVNATVQTVTVAQQLDDAYKTHKNVVIFYDGPGVVAPDYLWDYDGKCGSAFNSDQSCNPAADKKIATLRSTTNVAKRKAITDSVAKAWVAASPRIPVYQDTFVSVLNKNMKHYVFFRSAEYRLWSK